MRYRTARIDRTVSELVETLAPNERIVSVYPVEYKRMLDYRLEAPVVLEALIEAPPPPTKRPPPTPPRALPPPVKISGG